MEVENTLHDPDVLQHLFEFMDVNSLKKCRLVCKTWNCYASLQLVNKTWITLESPEQVQALSETFEIPSDARMKLLRNFELTRIDCCQTLGVLLQYRISIVRLQLDGFDNYLADTLLTLENLEHLGMNAGSEIPDWNRKAFGEVSFRKLKSCSLVCSFIDQENPSREALRNLMDFYIDLLQSCEKTLKRLQLSGFECSGYAEIIKEVNLQGLSELVLDEPEEKFADSNLSPEELSGLSEVIERNCSNIKIFKCFISTKAFENHTIMNFYLMVLKSCERCLEKLELSWYPRSSYLNLFAQVHPRKLTELVIDCCYSESTPSNAKIVFQSLNSWLVDCPNLKKFKCWINEGMTARNIRDILHSLVEAEEVEFLAKSFEDKSQLTELPIFCEMTRLTLPTPLGLPLATLAASLPKIRQLSIVLPEYGSEGWNRMEYLKELAVKSIDENTLRWQGHLHMTHANFPNLSKLSITLSAGSGRTVFAALRNLRELILEPGSSLCDEDITGIESGVLLWRTKMHEQVVRTRRQPFIGDLKSLKVLRLRGPFMTSVSLQYGVSYLDSLTHLTIQYPKAKVSRILRDKTGHHGDNLGNTRGSSVREVRLRPTRPPFVDIESIMLPKVPNLVELIMMDQYETLEPINPLQMENMLSSRSHLKFEYARHFAKAISSKLYEEGKFVFETKKWEQRRLYGNTPLN